MKAWANTFIATFLLFGSLTLTTYGMPSMQSAYRSWVGENSARHFYLSGSLAGIDAGTATVRVGIGGQMASYTLSVQGVKRVELPDGSASYVPVGAPTIYTKAHSAAGEEVFNELGFSHVMESGANAVMVRLIPAAGFVEEATSFALLLDGQWGISQQISQGGAASALAGPCPSGKKLIKAGCGSSCSVIACCTGSSAFLDCVNCRLECLD